MIVKMKFLSISGPRTDIDRVSASYLSKYEMQLENAITELKTTDNLMPFMDVNPYKEPLSKAEQYVLMLAQPKGEMDTSLTADEILTMIRDLNHDYLDLKAREDRLKKQKEDPVLQLWKRSKKRNRKCVISFFFVRKRAINPLFSFIQFKTQCFTIIFAKNH